MYCILQSTHVCSFLPFEIFTFDNLGHKKTRKQLFGFLIFDNLQIMPFRQFLFGMPKQRLR